MPNFKFSDSNTGKSYVLTAPDQASAVAAFQKFTAGTSAPPPAAPRLGQNTEQSSNIEDRTLPPPSLTDKLVDATGATVNGLVNGIPILGPLAQNTTDMIGGAISQATGGDYQKYVQHQQEVRKGYAEQAPVASIAGNVGGALASLGGVGALPGGAEALGLTGAKTLPRVVNGVLSTEAMGTADNMARGQKPSDALVNAVLPAVAGGAGGALVGDALKGVGGKIASSLTEGAQNKLTSEAIKGAPTSAELSDAGSKLFESSTGGSAPAVSAPAMNRFMTNVQTVLTKFRPNAANDPQAVGLLQHLTDLQTAASTPGVVVDFKDLHLARQLAQKVGQSSTGRDGAIGKIVVGQIDNFIKGLKPADILGSTDPKQAANDLMKGISTWSRAQRVSSVENAFQQADTYKSGFENGLKLSFLKLMRSDDFGKFSPAEQDAIRTVAKGTVTQNVAELFGKMGISFSGGAAHNILGGGLGTLGLSGALTPALGPLALPAAAGITTVAGVAGRHVAEKIAKSGAERAAQIVATPNIPIARQVPNMIAQISKPLEILIRGGVQGAAK